MHHGDDHMTPKPAHLRLSAIALVLALGAAACGGGDGDEADGGDGGDGSTTGTGAVELPDCPVGAHEAADGVVEVVVWHSFIAKPADTLQALTDEYNASQDKVHVQIESQGQDYEAALRTFTGSIASGDLPAVFMVDDPTTQFMADSGVVLPAQACFEADGTSLDGFLETAVSYYTVDGALQPGVLNIGNGLIYFNRAHFEEAGLDPDDPPSTLAEVRTAAQAIKDAGIVETPLVLSMAPWQTEFWLTGAGAPIVNNENGRSATADEGALVSDAAVELYNWFADMQADGQLNAIPNAEGNVDHYFALGREQSSMVVESSSAATSVAAFLRGDLTGEDIDGVDTIDTEGLDIDAGPFPTLHEGGTTQVGGTAWYLISEQPDEVVAGAWDWMTFMNTPEAQARWNLEGSFTPWVKAATEVPELQEAWSTTRLGSWLETAYTQVEAIDPDWPGPLIGPYTETRNAIRDSLDRLTLEDQAPEDTLTQANDEITAALETYADENF
jgi:sn-glycerol 3-phosphate transport system substrate-binding protein